MVQSRILTSLLKFHNSHFSTVLAYVECQHEEVDREEGPSEDGLCHSLQIVEKRHYEVLVVGFQHLTKIISCVHFSFLLLIVELLTTLRGAEVNPYRFAITRDLLSRILNTRHLINSRGSCDRWLSLFESLLQCLLFIPRLYILI